MTVRTRFAPSPTGYLHIGGVRTALFSWLYARKHDGKFILRIEDTDRERSTDESIQIILDGMQWLGLDYDEGPIFQTQRFARYQEIIQQLLVSGHAYPCYCSKEELESMRAAAMAKGEKPRYNGKCRAGVENPPGIKPVIRFKNPLMGRVIINDLIQGKVVYENTELDDLIIARSDGSPTYNLTVVVDDLDMGITHVIRGDDHLNNTPRQINIFNALDVSQPDYAHVPLILDVNGKRLSKRHGAVSIMDYRLQGFLPEALLNYLVRLGWSHGDKEIFSQAEMIELFDIKDINKSAASLNPEKLLWLNQHYLKTADNERLVQLVRPMLLDAGIDPDHGPNLGELVEVQKERTKTLREIVDQSLIFFSDFSEYADDSAKKHLHPVTLEPLKTLKEKLAQIDEWQDQKLHDAVMKITEEYSINLGKIAQPLRVAVTGTVVSPPIDVTLRLLGKEKVLARLDQAIAYIEARAAS
jgi:glutamyl-tRNA synthetase